MLAQIRASFALLISLSMLLVASTFSAIAAPDSDPHRQQECTARQMAYEAVLFLASTFDTPFLAAPDGYAFDTNGCLTPAPETTTLLATPVETANRRGGSMPAPPKPFNK
jgi:hypothetical protein